MRLEAIEAMQPFLHDVCANPSGSHAASRAAKTALEEARETVAQVLGASPREVVFTGGGSEGDNLAVKGAAWAARAGTDGERDGVVTTAMEHKAVLGAAARLERNGHRVSRIRSLSDGSVDLDALSAALDDRTAVVSVMTVNNETGVVQPLDEIADLVRARAPRAVLHTDAVQAPQWLDLREATRRADLVAISGHKFGGPKGVGALIARGGVPLVPLIEGGGHEWELRAGTQNVAGIVALATALAITGAQRAEETARIGGLRDAFESRLRDALPDMIVNGGRDKRVAGVLHAAFPGTEAETLLVALDDEDVYAASGSACSSGSIDPSHVLLAMGMPRELALASVRFSFGWASTIDDVERAADVVPRAVRRLQPTPVS
jgi:cysteine desulfurase